MENFIGKGLNVPNVMPLKIAVKYIFKDMCHKSESRAFIKF